MYREHDRKTNPKYADIYNARPVQTNLGMGTQIMICYVNLNLIVISNMVQYFTGPRKYILKFSQLVTSNSFNIGLVRCSGIDD